ncbi:hypothetical protein RRG08_024019 [Elysia crispata]|uniref:Uncharacterized protein n=1 Tax=Elysia crispata TaxID=231223 RepID=A0AAE1DAX0_9GAST|nr:hypothetical protein RRG08_024019 [Elysia crispata]
MATDPLCGLGVSGRVLEHVEGVLLSQATTHRFCCYDLLHVLIISLLESLVRPAPSRIMMDLSILFRSCPSNENGHA